MSITSCQKRVETRCVAADVDDVQVFATTMSTGRLSRPVSPRAEGAAGPVSGSRHNLVGYGRNIGAFSRQEGISLNIFEFCYSGATSRADRWRPLRGGLADYCNTDLGLFNERKRYEALVSTPPTLRAADPYYLKSSYVPSTTHDSNQMPRAETIRLAAEHSAAIVCW